MAEQRSKRVQLIIDLEANAETQAARNLGTAQDALAAERRRLQEVIDYYDTYSQHFSSKTTALNASDISRSRAFLANLDTACSAQKLQVKKAEQAVELALGQWRKCHHKVQVL
jgi:flagellar export protein FliJ